MKRLRLAIILCFSALYTSAQHEVKLNFSNVFFYEINGEYEYGISQYFSASLFGSYVYGFPQQDELNPSKTFSYIGPELRIYPGAKVGADGFFLGIYGKYMFGNLVTPSYQANANGEIERLSTDFQKTAIGITIGSKWLIGDHVSIGFLLGGGRILSYTYDSESIARSIERYSHWDQNIYDFRFGFLVGWRF